MDICNVLWIQKIQKSFNIKYSISVASSSSKTLLQNGAYFSYILEINLMLTVIKRPKLGIL